MNSRKEKAVKQTVVLVADDNGYADHKLVVRNSAGEFEQSKIASSIQIGGSTLTSVSGQNEDTYHVYDENGTITTTYTCSPAVSQPLDLRNAAYPYLEANRVLLHHGLTRAGLVGHSVKVGVTLPFSDFYKPDGTNNDELHRKTVENFNPSNVVAQHNIGSTDVAPDNGLKKDRANISSAHVFPEGMCAFYDWALNNSGTVTELFEDLDSNDGSMLIVDIGGSTTDIVCIRMVEGDVKIDHGHSGTSKIGVLDVKERINFAYQKKFDLPGHEAALSNRAIARIMDSGQHRAGGKDYELKPELEGIISDVAQRVLAFVRTKAGNLQDYEAIYFVGGGAVVFKEALTRAIAFEATFGDEFANARGLLKYMIANEAQ